MLGPNQTPFYHHRSQDFHQLLAKTEAAFKSQFGIPNTSRVLFISGSGHLALEACIFSSIRSLHPQHTDAKFGQRLRGLLEVHGKLGNEHDPTCTVQYETSNSRLNGLDASWLVDCVSSFPFYKPPLNATWVTVSGKQLGAPPGLGIVVVDERSWEHLFFMKDPRCSYLNLGLYVQARVRNETPNTPAMSILSDLFVELETRNYGSQAFKVNQRWNALVDEFGYRDGMAPPVYTFPAKVPAADKLGLYGKERTQLFLYSGSDREFDVVFKQLKEDKDASVGASQWWY